MIMTTKHLIEKTDLFLEQIEINANKEVEYQQLINFFQNKPNDDDDRHVLFKNKSLYYIHTDVKTKINHVSTIFSGNYYLYFDGLHISRIEPEYYLGPNSSDKGGDFGYSLGYTGGTTANNNNNNNNNNNGNNGNNG